jgi:hypothetical protein
MKAMTANTLRALRRIYESETSMQFIHLSIANALQQRGLAVTAGLGRPRTSGRCLCLTNGGTRICAALFGPLRLPRSNVMDGMNEYYVVVWDFEIEESGDIVKDGLVFFLLTQAKAEAARKMVATIDDDFAARVKPENSRRLNKTGFVAGTPELKRVFATDPAKALETGLASGGEDVDWSK